MGLRHCSRRNRASRRLGGNFRRCVNFACRSVFYFPFLQTFLFVDRAYLEICVGSRRRLCWNRPRLEGLRMLCWRRIEFLFRVFTGPTGRNRLSRLSNLFFPKVRGRRRSPGSGGSVTFFFGIRRDLRKRAGGIRRVIFKTEPGRGFLFHKEARVGFRCKDTLVGLRLLRQIFRDLRVLLSGNRLVSLFLRGVFGVRCKKRFGFRRVGIAALRVVF